MKGIYIAAILVITLVAVHADVYFIANRVTEMGARLFSLPPSGSLKELFFTGPDSTGAGRPIFEKILLLNSSVELIAIDKKTYKIEPFPSVIAQDMHMSFPSGGPVVLALSQRDDVAVSVETAGIFSNNSIGFFPSFVQTPPSLGTDEADHQSTKRVIQVAGPISTMIPSGSANQRGKVVFMQWRIDTVGKPISPKGANFITIAYNSEGGQPLGVISSSFAPAPMDADGGVLAISIGASLSSVSLANISEALTVPTEVKQTPSAANSHRVGALSLVASPSGGGPAQLYAGMEYGADDSCAVYRAEFPSVAYAVANGLNWKCIVRGSDFAQFFFKGSEVVSVFAA